MLFLGWFLFWIFATDLSGHISKQFKSEHQRRIAVALKKLLAYALLDVFGYYTLTQDESILDGYYMAEMSLYILLITQLPSEPRTKDKKQMLMHHLITLSLIITSYLESELKRLGGAIMLLHDLSDPFLESAKILNYLGKDLGSEIAFASFATIFLWTRLWVFPRYVVYEFWILESRYEWYVLSLSCFLILLCMHVYWTFQIFAVLNNAILRGEKRDVRDN